MEGRSGRPNQRDPRARSFLLTELVPHLRRLFNVGLTLLGVRLRSVAVEVANGLAETHPTGTVMGLGGQSIVPGELDASACPSRLLSLLRVKHPWLD